jgi:hypothetical protein
MVADYEHKALSEDGLIRAYSNKFINRKKLHQTKDRLLNNIWQAGTTNKKKLP